MRKKVGITGQSGFIGSCLLHHLMLRREDFDLIDFERSFFENPNQMDEFVEKCDVIVHLAAINRHENKEKLYETNVGLAQKLIQSFYRTGSKPHLIMSSSIQEHSSNLYGESKKDARILFSKWSVDTNSTFTGMIIPNVFGPFCLPFYNSVVATFCYQLIHDEIPIIDKDNLLSLIYVDDLVFHIIDCIKSTMNSHFLEVKEGARKKVSEILADLNYFRSVYGNFGEIPVLNSAYKVQLFNTYRSYINLKEYYPKYFSERIDDRGSFVEIIRHGVSGQTSYSKTLPGITRGNHYHTRKFERFAVIQGKALIQVRRIGSLEKFEFELDGVKPSYVDIPIWYTHNIKNIGKNNLLTVFWINEPFDPKDPDTYFENV